MIPCHIAGTNQAGMLLSASPLEKSYCVKVHKTLGSGADGTVIRGVVLAGDRVGEWHALKFMSNSAYCMQREVETLRRVTPHPNIIELVGVFHAQKQIVLAFPELDCSLHEYLGRRRGVVSPSLAMHVALQLLDAAAHMHHVHVLHRDSSHKTFWWSLAAALAPTQSYL